MDHSVRHCLRPSLTLWVHNQLFGFGLISNWGGHEIFRRLGKQILCVCMCLLFVYVFYVNVYLYVFVYVCVKFRENFLFTELPEILAAKICKVS
jgi:hypothetical protein